MKSTTTALPWINGAFSHSICHSMGLRLFCVKAISNNHHPSSSETILLRIDWKVTQSGSHAGTVAFTTESGKHECQPGSIVVSRETRDESVMNGAENHNSTANNATRRFGMSGAGNTHIHADTGYWDTWVTLGVRGLSGRGPVVFQKGGPAGRSSVGGPWGTSW